MNVITKNLDAAKAPLYCKYDGQSNPQPAYVELDCRGCGEIIADYNAGVGNDIPFYYYHDLAVRWAISPETSGKSLKELLADENFINLCERILSGFEEVWDGNNYVGKYSDDAETAKTEIASLIEQTVEQIEVWDVEEWLFSNCSLREHWCDQSLAEAVAELEGYLEENQEVDGDFECALLEKAKELFDDGDFDKLTKVHIAELREQDMITEDESNDWYEETGTER